MRSKAKLNTKLASTLSKKVKGYMSGGAKNTSGDQTLQSKSGSSSPQVDQRRVTRRAKAEKADKSKRAMDSDSESCSKEDAWIGDNDSVNHS